MATPEKCFDFEGGGLHNRCALCGSERADSSRGTLTSWLFRKVCSCQAPALDLTPVSQASGHAESGPALEINNRYDALEEIGSGGMGTVYKAFDRQKGDLCAVKVLRSELCSDRLFLQRFEREAQACISFSHANLVQVRDHGYTKCGAPFFAMEWLDGTALSTVLESKGVLACNEAVRIAIEICAALSHIHQLGIVHRDLKPANVVLTYEKSGQLRAKLVDFGIAKVTRLQHNNLTETGEIFGSPLYMSPEQCTGQPLDSRSDIYSLGCLLFECLTGSPPFSGATALETIMMHLVQLPEVTISVCPLALGVTLKCLEKEPDRRYQSAEALCRDLQRALARDWSLRLHTFAARAAAPRKLRKAAIFAAGTLTTAILLLSPFWQETVDNNWHTCNQRGQKAFDCGNYIRAREQFGMALKHARLRGEKLLEKRTLLDLSDLDAAMGHRSMADAGRRQAMEKEATDSVRKLVFPVTDQKQLASSLVKEGLESEERGDCHSATTAYEAALRIFSAGQITYDMERACALARLADLLIAEGKYLSRAQRLIEESRRINRVICGPQGESVAENGLALAECLFSMGKSQAAIAELTSASVFFERAPVSQLRCRARLAYLKGAIDADRTQLIAALSLYESSQLQDSYHHARTLDALAAVESGSGSSQSASAMRRRAGIMLERVASSERAGQK